MDDRGGHMNIALLEDDLSNLEYLVTLLQFKGHLFYPMPIPLPFSIPYGLLARQ